MKMKRTLSSAAVAGAILAGVFVSAGPAQAFDSIDDLCAGLSPGESQDDCNAEEERGNLPLEGEIDCYREGWFTAGGFAAVGYTSNPENMFNPRWYYGIPVSFGVGCIHSYVF